MTSIPAPTRERDRILRQFPSELAKTLVEFNKYVSNIDADLVIVMARKALRLHDLLVLAGGWESRRRLLSHHVLDQHHEHFRNKRIALIDDTLIVGTTLARAVQTLKDAGAKEITTHVFCADQNNWCRNLISPDRIFASLPQEQVLTFCAAEVTAMAHSAIPYLSDFPVTERLRLTQYSMDGLHTLSGWETFTLTTPSQEQAGVAYYTLLPRENLLAELRSVIGADLSNLLDIVKVRAFTRRVRTTNWARLVPIATLRPLHERDIPKLFSAINGGLGIDESALLKTFTTPKSQLRWIQYAISLLVGRICLGKLIPLLGSGVEVRFDLREAVRLFGHWLSRDIQKLHRAADECAMAPNSIQIKGLNEVKEAQLPPPLIKTVADEYQSFLGYDCENPTAGPIRSVFTDLIRAFVELYHRYELPARDEARRFGAEVFTIDASLAPHRDRLQYGFAWHVLAQQLLKGVQGPLDQKQVGLLSLALDHLIDMGIAVPMLCHRDGLLFRAYRHGEDVLFGDQELALAHDALSGFLEGSEKDSIPMLVLEKVISSLIRVGSARDFLKVLFGETGRDGVARIGFHLHGAIPIMPSTNTLFADDRQSWLSAYMVDRGVIRLENSAYRLGNRPPAALCKVGADEEARQFGNLMGILSQRGTDSGPAVLNESALILLSTCILPRDTAAALAAELRLFSMWYDRKWRSIISKLNWAKIAEIEKALQDLVSGMGYVALNSAKFKALGFFGGIPKQIIDRGEETLSTKPSGKVLASLWRGAWGPVLAASTDEEKRTFEFWIRTATSEILLAQMNLFSIELAMASAIQTLQPKKKMAFNRACAKIPLFIDEITPYVDLAPHDVKMKERLLTVVRNATLMNNPHKVVDFAISNADGRRSTILSLCRQIQDVVQAFGRVAGRTNFSYVLWYDIVDSTGQKSGLSGIPLKDYRTKVRSFKERIAEDLFGLRGDASRHDATVYGWANTIGSGDDEKHLFFGGGRSHAWLEKGVTILLRRAVAHGVRLRILAIDTSFGGDPAYKYANDPAVEGEQFWEHLSRIQQQLKAKEVSLDQGGSFFWIGGKLTKNDYLRSQIKINASSEFEIVTEIENISLQTSILGGAARSL